MYIYNAKTILNQQLVWSIKLTNLVFYGENCLISSLSVCPYIVILLFSNSVASYLSYSDNSKSKYIKIRK